MAVIDLKELLTNPKARKALTTPQIIEVTKQVNAILAAKGKTDIPDNPASFASLYSDGKWSHAPHLTILSKWIQEASEGKRKRILVSMPPRHGKSELISYWTPLWLLAQKPTRKIVLASYEADFAASWGRRIRDSIAAFGDRFNLSLSGSSTAASEWTLTSGGGMITTGLRGPLTGRGADCLIIDDPIKNDEEARSEVERRNKWEWFQTTAFTRLEPGAFVIVVATRWHEDDLLGRIEALAKNGGPSWDVLKFRAIAGKDDPLGRSEGDPLWAARYDINELKEIQGMLSPYHWGALYQQEPSPEEGNAVKREWWQRYTDLPKTFDQLIQSWDTSFSDMEKSDYAVGQVWGRKGAQFFLLDQIRARMNAQDMIDAIRHFTRLYPLATAKLIEYSANGPAVISMLQREVPGMIPIKVKANKFSRLQGVIPLFAAKNVFVPQNEDGTQIKWVMELIDECAAFPNSTHDDQVDATSQALNYLKPAGWQSIDKISKDHQYALDNLPNDPTKRMLDRFYKKAIRRSGNEIKAANRLFNPSSRRGW